MTTQPDPPTSRKSILTTVTAGLGAFVGITGAYTLLPRIVVIERGMSSLPFVALALFSGLLILIGWRIWIRFSINLPKHLAPVPMGKSLIGSALCGFGMTVLILAIATLILTGFGT